MHIHYFQRYHSKENVDTANAMLLLSRLYSYSSTKFFTFLGKILPENAEVELVFNLQEKSKDSIPDATITQSSFKVVVETKLHGDFEDSMMKKDLTELVFILDRSGSMSGLESDTIGGYNAMLEKQKKGPGEAVITTVLFDDRYELLHDRINLLGIAPITDKEYYVRGNTALLDAVGNTINKIGNVQKHTAVDERAEHVLFVITTDGMENSSCEFSYEKVRRMIEHQKNKYGWEFIFLGANIDAVATAQRFGIGKDRATNYNADSQGTLLNYEVISETVSHLRASRPLSENWKDRIEEDFKKRGGKR